MDFQNEIQKRLVGSFDEVEKYLEASKGFVAEQAPLVVQEMIRWGLAQSVFYCSIATLTSIILIVIGYKMYKLGTKLEGDWFPVQGATDKSFYGIGCLIPYIASLLPTVIALCQLHQVVYILVAPRLYLIDQVASIIGRMNGGR